MGKPGGPNQAHGMEVPHSCSRSLVYRYSESGSSAPRRAPKDSWCCPNEVQNSLYVQTGPDNCQICLIAILAFYLLYYASSTESWLQISDINRSFLDEEKSDSRMNSAFREIS